MAQIMWSAVAWAAWFRVVAIYSHAHVLSSTNKCLGALCCLNAGVDCWLALCSDCRQSRPHTDHKNLNLYTKLATVCQDFSVCYVIVKRSNALECADIQFSVNYRKTVQ